MQSLLDQTLGAWKAEGQQSAPGNPASAIPDRAESAGQLYLVDFPGATQVQCVKNPKPSTIKTLVHYKYCTRFVDVAPALPVRLFRGNLLHVQWMGHPFSSYVLCSARLQ